MVCEQITGVRESLSGKTDAQAQQMLGSSGQEQGLQTERSMGHQSRERTWGHKESESRYSVNESW